MNLFRLTSPPVSAVPVHGEGGRTLQKCVDNNSRLDVDVNVASTELRRKLLAKEQNAQLRKERLLHRSLVGLRAHHIHVQRVCRMSKTSTTSTHDESSIVQRTNKVEEAHRRARENVAIRQQRARDEVARAKLVAQRAREGMGVFSRDGGGDARRSSDDRLNDARKRVQRLLEARSRRAGDEIRHAKLVAKRVREAAASVAECRQCEVQEGRPRSSSDDRIEDAQRRAERALSIRVTRARGEVDRAKCVARRVRAARIIQAAFRRDRKAALRDDLVYMPELQSAVGHLGAVFTSRREHGLNGNDNSYSPASFESVTRAMQADATVRSATAMLRYLQLTQDRQGQGVNLSPKWFLSALFMGTFPRETLGDESMGTIHMPDATVTPVSPTKQIIPEDIDEQRQKDMRRKQAQEAKKRLLDKRLQRAACGVADCLLRLRHAHALLSPTCAYPSLATVPPAGGHLLAEDIQNLISKLVSFQALFPRWKNWDRDLVVAEMKRINVEAWESYLQAQRTLGRLGDHGDERLRLCAEENIKGSKLVLRKMRRKWDLFFRDNHLGWKMMKECKTVAEEGIAKEVSNAINREANVASEADNGREQVTSLSRSDAVIPPMRTKLEQVADGGSKDEPRGGQEAPELLEVVSNAILVHSILLTDPENVHELTWNGCPRAKTVTFDEFCDRYRDVKPDGEGGNEGCEDVSSKRNSIATSIATVMQRAFFDAMAEELNDDKVSMYEKSIVELNEMLRSLVPRRTDIHSFLPNEDGLVAERDKRLEIEKLTVPLLQAAKVLSSLEAPDRCEGTSSWIQLCETVRSSPVRADNLSSAIICHHWKMHASFVVLSLAYILHQVQQCQIDIANSRLTLVAPHIHIIGADYERTKFEATFGKHSTLSTVGAGDESVSMSRIPNTIEWVKRIVAGTAAGNVAFAVPRAVVAPSNEEYLTMLKTHGFVDNLLFAQTSLALPEVLSLDGPRILEIRQIAQVVVTGSALVIHACNAANIIPSRIRSEHQFEKAKEQLVNAIISRNEEGRRDLLVSDAVVMLARDLCSSTGRQANEASLRNYTAAVLRGDDPVLKLLDNRVRKFFRFMCKWKPCSSGGNDHCQAPPTMKTGREILSNNTNQMTGQRVTTRRQKLFAAGKKQACKEGFSFFAEELVEAGDIARNVVNLMCTVHGNGLLVPLMLTCASSSASE